jgi:cytochrome c-type biogenesis protein CcmH
MRLARARAFGMLVMSLLTMAATTPQSPSSPAGAGTPADSVLDARTTAVASTLRCPVCQGESIQDSPAELAQQMRAIVKEKLRNGETPEQIQRYFVARYGEWILLQPAVTGLNVLLYAFPIALVAAGLVIVYVLVRRWTAAAPAAAAAPAPSAAPSDELSD